MKLKYTLLLLVLSCWTGAMSQVTHKVSVKVPENGNCKTSGFEKAGMGVNLDNIDAFVNLIDGAYRFTPIGSGSGISAANVDEKGWPTTDFGWISDNRPFGEWWGTMDDPEAYRVDYSGVYKGSFTGQATLSKKFANLPFSILNEQYDAASNTTTFDMVVSDPGPDHGFWAINFADTKRTPSSPTGTGITDLKIIRPGYNPNTTQIFTDDFLYITSKGWSVLRHLNTIKGNKNGGTTYPQTISWADRKLPSDASQDYMEVMPKAYGWSYDYIIELANLTNTDLWITVPIAADDNYMTELAKFIKNNLNPSINVYLELSNEVWNSQFPQYDYIGSWADALGIQSYELLGKRTAEMALIFEDVFGEGSLNTKIRAVYAYNKNMLKWHVKPALNYVKNNIREPNTLFYGISRTTYISANATTVQGVIDGLYADSDDQVGDDPVNDSNRNHWIDAAENWGFVGGALIYEGGPHTPCCGKTENLDVGILAHRTPEMGDLLKYNMDDNWFQLGGGVAIAYSLIRSYSRHGAWGLTDDVFVPYRNYKMKAMLDLADKYNDGKSLTITTATLENASYNESFERMITAVGGSTPYTYSIASGALPTGVLLNTSEGKLYGTATEAGDFTFTIKVVDNEGAEATKELSLRVIQQDTENPSTPEGLTLSNITTSSAELSWTPSTDDVEVTGYEVYVDGNLYMTTEQTMLNLTGLSSGADYEIQVLAVDASGKKSALSAPVTLQTASLVPDVTLLKTSQAINIDGQEDGQWNTTAETIAYVNTGIVDNDQDLSATWKGLWDDQYLYLFVQVNDDVNSVDGTNAWNDDGLELYIDADVSGGEAYDGINDYQVGFQSGNNTSMDYGFNSATSLTGVSHAFYSAGTGYTFEVAIPWSSLGISPANGTITALDIHVIDDDNGGDREGKMAWADEMEVAWKHPSAFGLVALSDNLISNDADNDGVTTDKDCDDNDSNVGLPSTWYEDADADGLGDASQSTEACEQPDNYVATSGDECPEDRNKVAPEQCGCGIEEGSCIPTSTDDLQSQVIYLYPNPAQDMVHLSTSVHYELVDEFGTTWLKGEGDTFSVSGLPAGLYLLKAENKVFKLMKQ